MKVDNNNLLIILPISFLLMIGIVMVASSSIYIAEDMTKNPFHFVGKMMFAMS